VSPAQETKPPRHDANKKRARVEGIFARRTINRAVACQHDSVAKGSLKCFSESHLSADPNLSKPYKPIATSLAT
jgi:hypothetical protein